MKECSDRYGRWADLLFGGRPDLSKAGAVVRLGRTPLRPHRDARDCARTTAFTPAAEWWLRTVGYRPSMAINIEKFGDRYTATVTPPHGGSTTWSTDNPLPLGDLIDRLQSLGCHPTDIGDALHEADPEWELRSPPGP